MNNESIIIRQTYFLALPGECFLPGAHAPRVVHFLHEMHQFRKKETGLPVKRLENRAKTTTNVFFLRKLLINRIRNPDSTSTAAIVVGAGETPTFSFLAKIWFASRLLGN